MVGAHLGINATPYAARLVRDGHMQRSTDEADDYDAASLLGAILATPVPEMAVDALDTLAEATLGMAKMTSYPLMVPVSLIGETWEILDESQRVDLPFTVTDALSTVITERGWKYGLSLTSMMVAEGGWSAEARYSLPTRSGKYLTIEARYAHPDRHHHIGIKRYRELSHDGNLIGAVAELLAPAGARPVVGVHPEARIH